MKKIMLLFVLGLAGCGYATKQELEIQHNYFNHKLRYSEQYSSGSITHSEYKNLCDGIDEAYHNRFKEAGERAKNQTNTCPCSKQ